MEQNIQGEDNLKQFRDTDYYVSDDGNVYRKWNCGYKKMKQSKIQNRNYYRTALSINGKKVTYLTHRMVGECFIPNPDNKPEINHDDGNGLNNHISNLIWSTSIENMEHSIKNKLHSRGENHGTSKLTNLIVKQIREEYQFKSKDNNTNSLSKKYGVNAGTINNIIKNKTWKHI
jgi:hypothetical protein